jgi:glutamate 5-kinase
MEKINFLERCNKILIKIGSAGVISNDYVDPEKIKKYVDDLIYLKDLKKSAYFVSSGAIGTGRNKMQQYNEIAKALPLENQRFASVGQPHLVYLWESELNKHKLHASQILIDYDDLSSEKKIVNTSNLIEHCLKNSCIPIINYNDAVSLEEICLDNDTLASELVWKLKNNNDLLVILTSEKGLYGKDKRIIPYAKSFDINDYEERPNSEYGTGGLKTKLSAAKTCDEHSIPCIIASYQSVIQDILRGDCERTVFLPESNCQTNKPGN